MEPADHFLSKIVAWADADPNIRAVILTGSLARNDGTAELLGLIYPEEVDDNFTRYITSLRADG